MSNNDTYNSTAVLQWYKDLKGLTTVEAMVFEHHKALLQQANVLDIGIGGGRTTNFLAQNCKHYIGVDYSEGFVHIVREKHPTLDLRVMDARDLSTFKDGQFDLVNFSFNGIDYVDEDGRQGIFKEIRRVLKPKGVFFFSTHNMLHNSFDRNPWSDESLTSITRLKTFIKLFPFALRRWNNRKKETRHKNYAIINDSAHNYGLFTFYTTPTYLREQLMHARFDTIRLFGKSGIEKEDAALDDWIFITCLRNDEANLGENR